MKQSSVSLTLQVISTIAIVIGVICVCIASVQLIKLTDWECHAVYEKYYSSRKDLKWTETSTPQAEDVARSRAAHAHGFTIAFISFISVYLGCSVVFIITGMLGFLVARADYKRQSQMKTGLTVLSILNIVLFGPMTIFGGSCLSFIIPLLYNSGEPDSMEDILDCVESDAFALVGGAIVCVCGVIIVIISNLATSITCCCLASMEQENTVEMTSNHMNEILNGSTSML